MTVQLNRETYLPSSGPQLARVHAFMAAHAPSPGGAGDVRCRLTGPGGEEGVELPHEVYLVLRQVVEAMRADLAVTVIPQTMTLTTQQAADLLGVSRPTVIKLLDAERIPFERVGTHRRILLRDLLAYRKQRREERYDALAALGSDDDDEQPDVVLRRLREARKAVASRRRRPDRE
ncbi:helix-turn-helix domain-containing protein [Kineosporia sp. J2-2]|uniref:Helix-turn-helix domain-containing protein n=1 Tax=Kineosporia corallincola TaxID=2835133 RepID=A0ABS5TGU3_9ACTN|nr:helix-turn-helix domain-containing protein [Kineosporia corallincola]MBT0769604.1 helix-turn-helix domain-containing protein [Kineosporia corallincola]